MTNMYTEIEFLGKAYGFDVLETGTYPDWVWEKIGLKFTKEQWTKYLMSKMAEKINKDHGSVCSMKEEDGCVCFSFFGRK